jgi:hypothetical protein
VGNERYETAATPCCSGAARSGVAGTADGEPNDVFDLICLLRHNVERVNSRGRFGERFTATASRPWGRRSHPAWLAPLKPWR